MSQLQSTLPIRDPDTIRRVQMEAMRRAKQAGADEAGNLTTFANKLLVERLTQLESQADPARALHPVTT